jgi:hypothetical protein
MSDRDGGDPVEVVEDEMGLLKRRVERYLEVEHVEDAGILVMLCSSCSRGAVSEPLGVVKIATGRREGCNSAGEPGMIWGEISDIYEEGNEAGRQGRAQKEEGRRGEDTSGRCIGRVVTASDISGVYFMQAIGLKEEVVNSPKDSVGFRIVVSVVPPAFNNAGNVTMCDDASCCRGKEIKYADGEFKSDCLCPADVTLLIGVKGLPSGWSSQACQCPLTVTAMPTSELELEYADGLEAAVGGFMGQETSPCCRRSTHHCRSMAIDTTQIPIFRTGLNVV